MVRNVFLATAMTATLAASALPAQSRGNCAPHDAVVERLAERYGESRQVMALAADNSVVEMFASDETGSWTITVTNAGGLTCLVAAGQHYRHVAEVLPLVENEDEPA